MTFSLALRTSKRLSQTQLRGGPEAAINSAYETIDGMAGTAVVLVADWFPRGEMVVE